MENQFVGNAMVGQSGGPTAAINATLSGVIRSAIASPVIPQLYGLRNGIEGVLERRWVCLSDILSDEELLT